MLETDGLSKDDWRWGVWVAEAVGELLAASLRLSAPPRRERIGQALHICVEQVAGGNFSAWARKLGLGRVRMIQWHEGKALTSLEMLVWLCQRVGTTPLRFLTDDILLVPPWVIDQPRLSGPPRDPTRPARPLDLAAARQALEAALASDEQPPPSLAQVAERLGRPPTSVQHRLPQLCQAISARHRNYAQERRRRWRQQLCTEIRHATFSVSAAGLYPSTRRIAPFLSQPAFLRDPEARAALREALQESGW